MRISTPKRCPALEKAGWAVSGLIMFGRPDGRTMLAVRQHRVRDGPRTARGHQPRRGRLAHGLGVQEVEGHGDDLGFELGGTRAHVALERVHVGEVGEGFIQVVVVVVVTAVHRPRALATLPGGVLGRRHRRELLEHHLFRGAVFGQCLMYREAIRVGKATHVCSPRVNVDGKRPVRGGDTLRWNHHVSWGVSSEVTAERRRKGGIDVR